MKMTTKQALSTVQAYDVVQINTNGKWLDYSTIRDADISFAVGMVKRHPGLYRIIGTGLRRHIIIEAIKD